MIRPGHMAKTLGQSAARWLKSAFRWMRGARRRRALAKFGSRLTVTKKPVAQKAAVRLPTTYLREQLFHGTDAVSDEQVRLIQEALEKAQAAEAPELSRFTTQQALKIVTVAIRDLMKERDLVPAALHLAQNTLEELADRAAIAALRCRALITLQRFDDAVTEANRILALVPDKPKLRRALVELMEAAGLKHKLKHEFLWGPPGENVFVTLQNLDPTAFLVAFNDDLLDDLVAARNQPQSEKPALRAGMAWGLAVSFYRKYLTTVLNDPPRPTRTGTTSTSDLTEAYLESCRHIADAPPNPALQSLVAQGRSVIVLQSHSGARGLVTNSLAGLDCPLSIVGQTPRTIRRREGDFNLDTSSAEGLPLQFLKLAKLARTGPRVIRLMPDGRYGSEFGEIDLFGRKVSIGLGGALLAQHGKAVLAFAKTRWTGAGWVVEVDIGPDLAAVSDRAAAQRLFLDYYAESLRKILLGPARDIGGIGGYLGSLRRGSR